MASLSSSRGSDSFRGHLTVDLLEEYRVQSVGSLSINGINEAAYAGAAYSLSSHIHTEFSVTITNPLRDGPMLNDITKIGE